MFVLMMVCLCISIVSRIQLSFCIVYVCSLSRVYVSVLFFVWFAFLEKTWCYLRFVAEFPLISICLLLCYCYCRPLSVHLDICVSYILDHLDICVSDLLDHLDVCVSDLLDLGSSLGLASLS